MHGGGSLLALAGSASLLATIAGDHQLRAH
jgi:hypothetical protein